MEDEKHKWLYILQEREAMACDQRSKILIMGATGYLGKHMVQASLSLGHSTFALTRPLKPDTNPSKLQLHKHFQHLGVTIFQCELDDHEKLVSVLRQVDVVISTLAVPQLLDQLKVITALKEAGTIKRFVPSEFGNEADRVRALPPFEDVLEKKRKIRRAIEAAGLPYTYVSANSLASYFIDYFLHPKQPSDDVFVYGTGQAKAVFNHEEDVAIYTVKAATDPRAVNRVVICRPPDNIVSQLGLISSWEEKTGRLLNKIHVSEEQIINFSQTLLHPENVRAAILHNIFIKGDQMSFELSGEDLEASQLYSEYNYSSVDRVLDTCLVNPAEVKLTTF
ncbi:hypothetical protein Ddye_009501 [Dipteronia dyeriana]|uniref:NmrA-like domain-containing protein n=1 Tax=Dipteronia dyeriana TaxID=168575 RepID=A0AAD9XBJ2_9ROSI|nr:hypothetical protein Ddye_009501 [Dipteronia dyeriana]